MLFFRGLRELLLSSSSDDVTNTTEDSWGCTKSSRKESTKEHFLLSASGSTDNIADTVEDTWEGAKQTTNE